MEQYFKRIPSIYFKYLKLSAGIMQVMCINQGMQWLVLHVVMWHTGSALELVLLARLTSLTRWRSSGSTSNTVAVVLDWVCRSKSVIVKSCRRSPVRLLCSLACRSASRVSRHPVCADPAWSISIYTRCLHPRALPAELYCCGWTNQLP